MSASLPPDYWNRAQDLVGTRLARYDVREKLGGGGMGVVYEAYDRELQRTVALKFLSPLVNHADHARERLLTEARAAASLDHPNIGTIYEVGERDGQLFIAMALYHGETLRDKIRNGPLPVDEAVDYAVQIARGLAAAHHRGIIHRDIKAANVIVTDTTSSNTGGLVKIVDFGLAKMDDVALTRTGSTLGTVAYMSPEQARGDDVDHRTDAFAFGILVYEMLTGERPFKGDYDQAVLYSILNVDPKPLHEHRPDLPADLEKIVLRCLEKDKANRYPTTTDLLADLESLGKDDTPSPTGADHPFSPAPLRPAFPLSRRATGIGLLAVFSVLIIAVFTLRSVLSAASIPGQRALVVLPFSNVDKAPENQPFIDGLVYTMTAKLTEMERFQSTLSVVPARDVMQATLSNTREIADRFKVNLVVTGSVQREEANTRITIDLVDPRAQKTLRSRQIDAPTMNMADLQDQVVFRLAELLDVELNAATEQALTAGRTANSDAFDFYTQALGYLQRFEDETNIDAAIKLFELAVKEDPSYALAYAGLGEAFLRKYQARQDTALVTEALMYGNRAQRLDDNLPSVHVTLGMIYFETGQYDQAELAYLRALALEPKHAAAHHALGDIYARQGKPQKAEASYQEAITLKPTYWLYLNDLGQFYHRQNRHEDAIPKFEDVIALQPDNPWGYNNLGAQYARLGRMDEAIRWYERATQVNPDAIVATAVAYWNLGGIYYGRDDFPQAITLLEKGVALQETDREAWENLGDAYYWNGNREKAYAAWQQAVSLCRERLAVNSRDVYTLGYLAEDYARLGERDSSYAVLQRLFALQEQPAMAFISAGKAYEILDDRPRALDMISEGLDRGFSPTVLEYSAWLDALRRDPRYQDHVQSLQPAP